MPTQEERLDTVEFNLKQFKTETIKAYSDMAYEMAMIGGLTKTSIERIGTLQETIEQRFDRTQIRFDGMDAHLDHMDKRLSSIESRLTNIETTLNQILARLP